MPKAQLLWQPDEVGSYVLDPDSPSYDDNLRMMGAMGRAVLLVYLEHNARRIRQFVHRQECSEDSRRHP